jgi:hypothetical protein
MKNIFTFLFFVFTTNSVFAQVNEFKITASADVPTTLLVKRPDLVSQTIDTINIENSDLKRNISIDQPQAAILETDQQQVMIWMIPGYSLHVKIENNQLVFGGQAALYADYFQNKQNNFINFCHYYNQRNPTFNENAKGYRDFLDSVTVQQVNYFKKYFINNRSNFVKQFMEEETASLYYENLSRKLMFGDMALENFKPYQKINGLQSAAYYPYSEKVSFTNPELLKIYFFQQFAGQFVAEVSLKKQKESSAEFNFTQYLEIAMQTINQLTGDGPTNEPIKAIFLVRVIEEMERNNKTEWSEGLNTLISSLIKKTGNKHFLQLKERLITLSSAE